jgi:hypothetical protein
MVGRYGQAILTIVGTVVGAYFGYPALGAALGSLAGSLLFPTQLPTVSGPRLADLTQTTSAVGTSIPRVWGTCPVPGAVIYKSDIREIIVSEEVGGKGGAQQTVETPTYYQDFAVGLCEGEDPIALLGPIAGVRRIWANGKCIYDRRPREDGESEADFNSRIAASNVLDTQMVIYLGTEDQEPDPTIEADPHVGVGNVSAFRGYAYIVFINWQNLPEDGNKMPLNWKFEVYTDGALDPTTAFEYSNEYLPPWNTAAEIPIFGSSDYYNFTVRATGWSYGSGRARASGSFPTLQLAMNAAAAVALRQATNFMGYSILPNSGSTAARGVLNTAPGEEYRTVGAYDPRAITLHFNAIPTTKFGRGGNSWPELAAKGMAPGVALHTNGYFLNNDVHNAATAGVYQWWPGNYASAVQYRRSVLIDHAITTGRSSNPGAVLITGDLMIYVERKGQPPGDQCAVSLPQLPGYCISTRGNLVRLRAWTKVNVSFASLAKVLSKRTTRGVRLPGQSINHTVSQIATYPLNPALPHGHADYDNQTFWETAYNQAVAIGALPAGWVYGVNYPRTSSFYYRRQLAQDTIETFPVPLPDVVGDILRESGYVADDYNVTALTGKTVLGYSRTRVMAGRAALEPLRQAKFFDGIESNGKIKFVVRGGPIVAEITSDELGVTVAGEDTPSRLTTTTADETTLPRSVRVHYLAISRDYEPGEQISPARAETRATNDVDVELAMVLEDDEAAQIAEVLWAEAWTARRTHSAVIDAGRQELEPTDPIEVPVDGRMRRVRILSIEDSLPALRRLDLVRDDDGGYISRAIGTTTGYVRPTLQVASPAELVLLDLPAIRDEDDDAGIYAAVRPYLTDTTFRGATILRSADGGASYTSLGPVGVATPLGYLLQTPTATEPYTIWDEVTVLRVQMQYGDLESRTESAVLNGANAAAIGAHGRWEIVQFRDAEYLGEGIWLLTGLLRGRRGTEHNIGASVAGDRFVMLSMGGLIRLPLNTVEIGVSRLYKIVATGTRFGDAEPQEFTGTGEALRPFSPVHIEADLEADDDIDISWVRRGRIGQTLQSGTEIALSEETEGYEVDILVDGAVVRTIETDTPSATYTAIEQGEDFDSPAPTSITVQVYQMSAIVGRGHVGELAIVLADLPADTDPADVEPDELLVPDADALLLPLVYDEVDEAVAPLTWTRFGDGPRITPAGMVGDGLTARLRATAGLPGYATSNAGNLYLRATITAFDCGARNGTADRIVSVCVNDATANPRLEFAIVDDGALSTEPNIAVRSYTGSMQTKRLSRREWRFACTYPEKTRSSFGVRPQGILLLDGTVITCEHYEEQFSTAHKVDPETGANQGVFQFAAGLTHVSAIADRPSDGTVWFLDATTEHLLQVDLEASFESQAAVVLADVDLSALTGAVAIDWVVIGEAEYLLVAENAGGMIYVFDATDVVDGATLVAADRVTRLQGPANCQGIVFRLQEQETEEPEEGEEVEEAVDGLSVLYVATTGSGANVRAIDFGTWFETGTDGESYTGYLISTHGAPSAMVGDIDIDEAGNVWMPTEGRATLADDTDWFAIWLSPLTGSVENIYSAYYAGGVVTVRINDRAFCTLAWTPTPTPAAVSIGGPPQAALGQTNGFFLGTVRDVVIQGTDYDPDDFDQGIVYENGGTVDEYPLEIINPAAEDGVTGWTNEVGALTVDPSPNGGADGGQFWNGGNNAHTKARQRLDLSSMVDFDITRVDAGDCWAIVRWYAAEFASQNDTQALGFRFLDAAQVQISETLATAVAMDPSGVWIPRNYAQLVPANTRYVDILIDMVRVDGTQNDGWVDLISAALYVPTPSE